MEKADKILDRVILNRIGKTRINNRQIDELIGLAHGMVADEKINQLEAEYLLKWLVANKEASANPVVENLLHRVSDMLHDNILDKDEAKELLETLKGLTGGNFELGEMIKSTKLPLTEPKPEIIFQGHCFCFTGTFVFGKRTECEQETEKRGGIISKTIKNNLDYLVIGIDATDSWVHSTFGLKIEKALELNKKSADIKIISEANWVEQISDTD